MRSGWCFDLVETPEVAPFILPRRRHNRKQRRLEGTTEDTETIEKNTEGHDLILSKTPGSIITYSVISVLLISNIVKHFTKTQTPASLSCRRTEHYQPVLQAGKTTEATEITEEMKILPGVFDTIRS